LTISGTPGTPPSATGLCSFFMATLAVRPQDQLNTWQTYP
jgi:hypothetical protein